MLTLLVPNGVELFRLVDIKLLVVDENPIDCVDCCVELIVLELLIDVGLKV